MNMTEITLVGIITSATLATSMMNASNQVDKINEQQAQVKCLQQSVDNLNNNINQPGTSFNLYNYAREIQRSAELNQEQSIEQKCKINE